MTIFFIARVRKKERNNQEAKRSSDYSNFEVNNFQEGKLDMRVETEKK